MDRSCHQVSESVVMPAEAATSERRVLRFGPRDRLMAPFAEWESFYVIVGSSAAALTGLQFVVLTLIADSAVGASAAEVAAFGTPTVVHFSAVLLMSAILSAPW